MTRKSVLEEFVQDGNINTYKDLNLIKEDSISILGKSKKLTPPIRIAIRDIKLADSIERVQQIVYNSYLSFNGQKVI